MPTAPPYAFANSLPPAVQYGSYIAGTIPSCNTTTSFLVCPGTVAVTAGSLPPGIQLNGGILQGNPFTAGTYSFTLEARTPEWKNYSTITHDYTLVVEPYRSVSSGPAAPQELALPRRSLTPGSTDPSVRQSTIRTTICATSWTRNSTPPAAYTNALKIEQMKLYGEHGSPSAYREDHLIPLELGGAPRSPKNLWPEPRSQSKRSRPLATALNRKVCAGAVTLAAARRQILLYKRTKG